MVPIYYIVQSKSILWN